MNPNTGKSSGTENEFSAQNWNARTCCHLKDIKALGEEMYNEVFDMAVECKLIVNRHLIMTAFILIIHYDPRTAMTGKKKLILRMVISMVTRIVSFLSNLLILKC